MIRALGVSFREAKQQKMKDLMTIKNASIWASNLLGKNVTPSNISYLVQYGRIPKIGSNASLLIDKHDLEEYYNAYYETKENRWRKKLGQDLNWQFIFFRI